MTGFKIRTCGGVSDVTNSTNISAASYLISHMPDLKRTFAPFKRSILAFGIAISYPHQSVINENSPTKRTCKE